MNTLYHILDENKRVVPTDDAKKWSEFLSKRENKVVKQDELRDGYRISTVFLGIDHGFGGTPRWFETMIFEPDTFSDVYCQRYETWGEAWNGHIVAMHKFNDGTLLNETDDE